MALGYIPNGIEKTIDELRSKDLVKKLDNGGLKIGWFDGFQVGGIFVAKCYDDFKPEKWDIFFRTPGE